MSKTINQSQIKRLYTIASFGGWSHREVKRLIAKFKGVNPEFASATIITVDEYEKFVNFFMNSWDTVQQVGEDLLWQFDGMTGNIPTESDLEGYRYQGEKNAREESIEDIESEECSVEKELRIEENPYARYTEGLNHQQSQAVLSVVDWYFNQRNSDIFSLIGSAGTGKSFTAARILSAITDIDSRSNLLCIAPTHAAKKVLTKFIEKAGLNADVTTVHSALGLGLDFDESGKQINKKASDKMEPIRNYQFVLCDEAFMLNSEVAEKLKNICYAAGIKLLLLGDDLQLPPVGEDKSYFLDFDIPKSVLTQVMRNSGLSTELQEVIKERVRKNELFSLHHHWINGREKISDDGLNILTEFQLRARFLEEFEKDIDETRYLAFSNASVRLVNQKIRKFVFDYEEPYTIGENLVANRPITTDFGRVSLANNGDLLLINGTGKDRIYIHGELYDVIVLHCSNLDLGKEISIFVFDQSSEDYKRYSDLLEKLNKEAIKGKSKSLWARYYGVLESTANVSHVYAMTIHKSQGQSKEKIFCESIQCADMNLQPRLWYVSSSRHTDSLCLMR